MGLLKEETLEVAAGIRVIRGRTPGLILQSDEKVKAIPHPAVRSLAVTPEAAAILPLENQITDLTKARSRTCTVRATNINTRDTNVGDHAAGALHQHTATHGKVHIPESTERKATTTEIRGESALDLTKELAIAVTKGIMPDTATTEDEATV